MYVLCVSSHFWPFTKANLVLENFNKKLGFGQAPPPLFGQKPKFFRKSILMAPLIKLIGIFCSLLSWPVFGGQMVSQVFHYPKTFSALIPSLFQDFFCAFKVFRKTLFLVTMQFVFVLPCGKSQSPTLFHNGEDCCKTKHAMPSQFSKSVNCEHREEV